MYLICTQCQDYVKNFKCHIYIPMHHIIFLYMLVQKCEIWFLLHAISEHIKIQEKTFDYYALCIMQGKWYIVLCA